MNRDKDMEPRDRLVTVEAGGTHLKGFLTIPRGAKGIVLFAHGSGSSRFSPRNNYVARVLQDNGIGTLLIDLLTEEEAQDQRLVFDIDFLTQRLEQATNWLRHDADTRNLSIGYFGASTGAASALEAAASERTGIAAVVSRGGRPDLACGYLDKVTAPTLLIVGGYDEPVVSLNREAYKQLQTTKELVIVPRATHLFEEPGALEEVARLASRWFRTYLTPAQERAA